MDPLGQRILWLYDELERPSLDLHTILEMAGGKKPAEREAVLDSLAALVRQQMLEGQPGDFYSRTEDGRLAAAGPLALTLYSRQGCLLCDEMKRAIEPLLGEFGASLRVVEIDSDPALVERYTNDVPVLFLAARKVAKHRVDLLQLRRQLAHAKSL
ncbi:MAG: glutaredoxin family protein [Candidatus Acidiferrales bacterium]